ncbi:hypothetical protein LCGC14_0231250 [marine sediment metagenome]|uniref:Uncharacterized protein n=1 Tax=marine sediment metagenome TaxID=412755 RepID=A0A0F9XE15_9ZZZZ
MPQKITGPRKTMSNGKRRSERYQLIILREGGKESFLGITSDPKFLRNSYLMHLGFDNICFRDDFEKRLLSDEESWEMMSLPVNMVKALVDSRKESYDIFEALLAAGREGQAIKEGRKSRG